MLVGDLGGRVDPDRDAVLERQPAVPRDVVGMRVRLERTHDPNPFLLRCRKVRLDRVGGVDDDRLVGLLVADEIRRTAQVVVDELPEDHGFDRNTRDGLFS